MSPALSRIFAQTYHPMERRLFDYYLNPFDDGQTFTISRKWRIPNRDHLCLLPNADDDIDENTIPNAVARFVLLNSLPGSLFHSRAGAGVDADYGDACKKRTVQIVPRFLFKVYYEESRHFSDFFEEYYLAYLPGFDVHVVVQSMSTREVYGYHDLVLGVLRDPKELVHSVRKIIIENWKYRYVVGGHARWTSLVKPGGITRQEARICADTVWNHGVDEVFDYEYGDKKKTEDYGFTNITKVLETYLETHRRD